MLTQIFYRVDESFLMARIVHAFLCMPPQRSNVVYLWIATEQTAMASIAICTTPTQSRLSGSPLQAADVLDWYVTCQIARLVALCRIPVPSPARDDFSTPGSLHPLHLLTAADKGTRQPCTVEGWQPMKQLVIKQFLILDIAKYCL